MSTEASIRFKARVAGLFYFLLFPFGALSLLARPGLQDRAGLLRPLQPHERLAHSQIDLPAAIPGRIHGDRGPALCGLSVTAGKESVSLRRGSRRPRGGIAARVASREGRERPRMD